MKKIIYATVCFVAIISGVGIHHLIVGIPSQRRFDEAMAKWKQRGADSYLLKIHLSGRFFGPHGTQTIIVDKGKVVAVVTPSQIITYKEGLEKPSCHITVERLFEMASQIIRDRMLPSKSEWGSVRAIIRYDRVLGYPKYISFDYPRVGDEETRIIVLSLELRP